MAYTDCDNSLLFELQKERLLNAMLAVKNNNLLLQSQKDGINSFLQSSNQNYSDFSKLIPVSSKLEIFQNDVYMNNLSKELQTQPTRLILSAGTSRTNLSFRPFYSDNEVIYFKTLAHSIEKYLQIDFKNTFVINAYAGGIQLPPNIIGIDIGPRPELIPQLISQFENKFKHIAIIAQPDLLKVLIFRIGLKAKCIENIKWIIGGAWFSSNFITALSEKLLLSTEKMNLNSISFYGLSEIGLNIGIQTPELSSKRTEFKTTFPMLFELNSELYFYETIQDELYLTPLNPNPLLPLFRYRTGDRAQVVTDGKKLILSHCARLNLNSKIKSETSILEVLYSNVDFFKYLTGRFKINNKNITFESLPNVTPPSNIIKELESNLNEYNIVFDTNLNPDLSSNDDLLRKWIAYEK